jgi:type IV pilus assembly protein PilC
MALTATAKQKPLARTAARRPGNQAKADKAFVFTWEGTDRKGSRISGETRASNPAMVRAELRHQGVNPVKIRKKATPLLGPRKKKIRAADIAIFSRQLATMLAAGVPVVQAFEIVGRGHENPSMQDLILSIKADVESGTALAESLRKHPLYFDDLFCNLVEAGEAAGVLDSLLDKIATYKEKTESIKGKIKKALFYPTAVIVVAVLVTAIIMIFVIPQFKALFASFGADLPAFTLMVIGISEFMQQWWWLMLGVTVGVVYSALNLYKRSRRFRHLLDRFTLLIPVIGMIMRKSALARFARTLSTVFAAGVPLVDALESVAGATGSIVYADAVLRMRESVATGQSLQLTMKQQNLFPHMVIQMTAIGEESGALDDMLSKVADFYEEEVDNAVDSLSSLMEPMIMVIIGGMVGSLVVAMYLPIFKMAAVV